MLEIKWTDQHLEKIINLLEKKGILDNTIIIVTSDNGMAFPGAKATLYEYGIHVPLAIRWGNGIKSGEDPLDCFSKSYAILRLQYWKWQRLTFPLK